MGGEGCPGHFRQLMFVNINSYGAGLNVVPPSSRLQQRPSPADGILEVLAVRNPFTTLCLFSRLTKPVYLASSSRIAFRLSIGEWMQLDGEPWRLDIGCDVLIEPHRKLTMLCAPLDAPFWRRQPAWRYWEEESVGSDGQI